MPSEAADSTTERVGLLARALAAGVGGDDLLEILARQAMAGLGADGAVIGIVDAARGVLEPEATYGRARASLGSIGSLMLEAELPLTVAARTAEPVWVTSRSDARARFPRLVAAFPGSRSFAAIPMTRDGRPIGALGITFDRAHEFDETQRAFLSTLADLCTVAWASRSAVTGTSSDAPEHAEGDGDSAIAERLHAVVIRDLFAATLSLGAVAALVDGPTRDRLIAVIEQHDAIIREVRQAVVGRRRPARPVTTG